MRKIRIALGSNDGKTIASSHLGDAKDFITYDLFENGTSNFVEKRKNTSPDEDGKHGRLEKMKAVMEILKEADIIIGRRMSPNFVKMAAKAKFQPMVIEVDEISEIVEKMSLYFDKAYDLIEQRESGNFPKEIPVLGG